MKSMILLDPKGRQRSVPIGILYLSLLLSLWGAVGISHAQVITGAISGTISDSTGALLPGVTVTVTNQGTAISHTLTTDNKGFYSAEGLSDGDYTIAVSKKRLWQSTDAQYSSESRTALRTK